MMMEVQDVVRTRKLEIVNEKEEVVCRVGVEDGLPMLTMYPDGGEDGWNRIEIGFIREATGTVTAMALVHAGHSDTKDGNSASLWADVDGSSVSADRQGTVGAELCAEEDEVRLSLHHPRRPRERILLRTRGAEPLSAQMICEGSEGLDRAPELAEAAVK